MKIDFRDLRLQKRCLGFRVFFNTLCLLINSCLCCGGASNAVYTSCIAQPMKMKAAISSEIPIFNYQLTRHHISEKQNLHKQQLLPSLIEGFFLHLPPSTLTLREKNYGKDSDYLLTACQFSLVRCGS